MLLVSPCPCFCDCFLVKLTMKQDENKRRGYLMELLCIGILVRTNVNSLDL